MSSDRPRNTNNWYDTVDPLAVVDRSLVEFVHKNAGHKILDLGCGVGGYSHHLNELGHSCRALDINPSYVQTARMLGVDATVYDGKIIPLDDKSVDTVIAIEVLEHVIDPTSIVKEIARVAKISLIASVPNCTGTFGDAPVVFNHMLDTDHKSFFTIESFKELLSKEFPHVDVQQIFPVDRMIAEAILPRYLFSIYEKLLKWKFVQQRRYFRLVGIASLG